MQESADGTDAAKADSVRKVLRIAVRRTSSLSGDVTAGASLDCGASLVADQPTYVDASVATDAHSGTTDAHSGRPTVRGGHSSLVCPYRKLSKKFGELHYNCSTSVSKKT